ncbi:MAG: caspase family protein [Deltaproteobacteria bacterium]|nr:caspase family protein [Deltaproteobacteria bacterium]
MLFHSATGRAAKAEHRYAIIVGNNSPGEYQRDTLQLLRYADDDAIRMFMFLSRIASKVWLLTVADETTQRRYPEIVDKTEMPTLNHLARTVEKLKKIIASDTASGIKSTVYLYFSGHGAQDSRGVPGLLLVDGHLTRDALYSQIIGPLNADFVHLLIDACYAEGVVGSRGLFDNEADATREILSQEEQLKVTPVDPSRYPGLGIFLSSSTSQQSHEWSRLESGVFTHVVLSGLSGLADINGDGEIAYSELYAFTVAANRSVEKEFARVDVVATPPDRNQNEPIVDISDISNAAFLTGDMSRLSHFYVELENGQRFADGHLRGISNTRFWVPANQPIFVYSEDRESVLTLDENHEYNIGNMVFATKETATRGSIETSLTKGLFSSAYSPEYYKGIIDSSALIPVAFHSSQLQTDLVKTENANFAERDSVRKFAERDSIRQKKIWSTSLFAFAAVSGGLAAAFAILSLHAKDQFYSTSVEKTEKIRNSEYQKYGTSAWIAGALVPIAITAAIVVWPKNRPNVSPPPIALGTNFNTAVQLNYTLKF